MLSIPGFSGLKRIRWKDIEPGMIVIGGLKLNGTTPYELANYPALTVGQIYEITQKYHFKKDKEVIVAVCKKGESSQKMSKGFSSIEKKINLFNNWRRKIISERNQILEALKLSNSSSLMACSEIVELSSSFTGRLNSTSVKHKLLKKKPSCFHQPELTVSLSLILSGEIKKTLFLPEDFPLFVQIGLGINPTFKESNFPIYQKSLEYFTEMFTGLLDKAKIELYALGETMSQCSYPLSGREVEAQVLNLAPFIKRVMHKKNKEITNLTVLILPEKPKDWEEVLEMGEKFVKASIDVIFLFIGNWSSQDVDNLSNAYNANSILLKKAEFLPVLLIEALDEYLGRMTIERTPIVIPEFQEFTLPSFQTKKEEPKKEKIIKPFEFKKIKRK